MNEPKLRFKNDNGKQFPDWEEKRVADVANRVKVGFVGACERYYTDKNGIPLYRTGNLQLGKLIEDDMKYVSKEFHIANKKSQLHKGDILVARHGSSGNAVLYNSEKEANCLNIVIIQPNLKTVNPKFMVESINSPNVVKQVSRLKNGSTQVVLNTKDIENLDVNIPSLSEQQKIALLFSELDTLIESAEKELEGYRELKQGMLQKMFPKNGEKVPEIRFPEFTGDWEQHKLGEVAPLRGGYAFKSDKYKTEGTPIVRISNILSDGSVGAEFAYYDDIEDDEKCTLGNGDALLAMSGATTGKVSILKCNNNDKYYQNQRVGYFERNEQYNYGFVSTIVRSDLFKEQLTLVLVAGAQPNVSSKEIDAFEFMFPNSIVEQKKIGEYFSNLDNLIALQQQELDGYKELKKGLLQQMFC